MPLSYPKLRVARPTDNILLIKQFYCDGLGLQVLSSFTDHQGFDGVMLGHPQAPYHLEFTHQQGHRAGRAPTADNLLVFYLPHAVEWQAAVQRMLDHGYAAVPAYNPYWDERGRTFEDPDGYRVVLQQAAWDL
ncbi:VOC family protein [Hymenobacter sp. BT491]|uniref:VOC family protein n=1 Tax=Hymenobacter sp. BT491 TaxID=2766779 RepID=UPI001653D520|nr:VOC family protein [Hymenobacter sp. BT491]MBC6991412.1 VOC family protein [Hymenobacter sp. BT491]